MAGNRLLRTMRSGPGKLVLGSYWGQGAIQGAVRRFFKLVSVFGVPQHDLDIHGIPYSAKADPHPQPQVPLSPFWFSLFALYGRSKPPLTPRTLLDQSCGAKPQAKASNKTRPMLGAFSQNVIPSTPLTSAMPPLLEGGVSVLCHSFVWQPGPTGKWPKT